MASCTEGRIALSVDLESSQKLEMLQEDALLAGVPKETQSAMKRHLLQDTGRSDILR